MQVQQEETISAIATAPGEGGIGIIRISGTKAIDIAKEIFVPFGKKSIDEYDYRYAIYGNVVREDREVIDEAICIMMKSPFSYTCEDVAEIQCHGGPIVMREILSLTYRMGARPAEPGEFTKRAFLNGRLDLSQAQAVMDVINSKTKASLQMAMDHLSGRFSDKIKNYRQELLSLIAHLEASIDFPEDDIEDTAISEAKEGIFEIKNELKNILASATTGIILRDGLRTAIIGKPNAGKSSLMNLLLGQDRAIVTDIPGTTRDSIEEYVNIGGIPLLLIDTAGIRFTDDIVEKIGVEKSYSFAKDAELVLAVLDGNKSLDDEDDEIFHLMSECSGRIIVIINKIDLSEDLNNDMIMDRIGRYAKDKVIEIIKMSATTGVGKDLLENSIKNIVYNGKAEFYESSILCDARQSEIIRQACQLLDEAETTIDGGMSEDFIVIDIRSAWEKLGEIIGETLEDDIIDQIFRQFCLGK